MTTTAPADTAPDSKPLRLAAGKYYRTRSGVKVGPLVHYPDGAPSHNPPPP